MKMIIGIVLIFAVVFQARAQFSQPGELDTTFNFGRPHSFFTDPANPQPGEGANSIVRCLARQPDGKVIIGGEFTSYNGTLRNRIARLNADGSLDSTFNPGTGANSGVWSLALQPDGKVLIGGDFTSYNGTPRIRITRLNANGSLDATFNPGTGANKFVLSIVIQPDGKVMIGGDFSFYNGALCSRIARLKADGSLDANFNLGTGASGTVRCLALQPDGKALIGGIFFSYNGTSRRHIARLNSDGSLDATFNPGTGANNWVYSLTLQSSGKVLIGGDFTFYNGTLCNRIVRINTNGSLDTTFSMGTGANGSVFSIAIQPDSKVLIWGGFTTYNSTSRNRVARLNADGSLDASFNPGSGANDFVSSLVLQPDGKVLIGGLFTIYNGESCNYIARLNADGSLDMTFNPRSGVGGAFPFVSSLALQPDSKVLIGGDFSSPSNKIARLNSDGRLDSTFNPGIGANGTVLTLALQPDGKVLVGGDFTSYNGISSNRIARLNPDGSLDTNFNSGIGVVGVCPSILVWTLALQPDGKVLIGGSFTSYNGTPGSGICRLNANGSIDTTFNLGTGVVGGAFPAVSTICLQADGKVLIGGQFTSYNGTPRNRIARLNADGNLDTTFLPGTGANSFITTLTLQPDGKVLIGGGFTSYSGTSRNRIARLNSDGSLDSTFNLGTGANNLVWSLALQPDGKVLIGGDFTSYNGTPGNYIVRLKADGSLDTTFKIGTGADETVHSLALQPDGKLMIGGSFTLYNGIYRSRIARILTESIPVGIPDETADETSFHLFPNPFIHQFHIVAPKPFHYQIFSIEGRAFENGYSPNPELSLSTSAWPSGTYILRIITEEGVSVRKLVKE